MIDKKIADKNKAMAIAIAEAVRKVGGATYYVGGCVRDELRGEESKDIDIEVHGIDVPALRGILLSLGSLDERKVGDSFGIFALKGYDLDIALPRSERATGAGTHTGFIIDVDPHCGTYNAAKRRDFTINAIYKNVLTGEIVDHFGGLKDLKAGILRHVDPSTFIEDPLRAFRAAQFAARFGYEVAPETAELIKTMDLTKISRERIAGELGKALLKSRIKPSAFFRNLASWGQLSHWFPEVEALIGVPQDPAKHPEGDVFEHTMRVLDEAALYRANAEHPLFFMVAALCHDFGKPKATAPNPKTGAIQALGHEALGVEPAEKMIDRIFFDKRMKEYVSKLVKNHMRPFNFMNGGSTSGKKFMRLFDENVYNVDLVLLFMSDQRGRGLSCQNDEIYFYEKALYSEIHRYERLMAQPQVTGEDLIALGLAPGPKFGEILALTHKIHLAGVSKEEALRQAAGIFGFKRLLKRGSENSKKINESANTKEKGNDHLEKLRRLPY